MRVSTRIDGRRMLRRFEKLQEFGRIERGEATRLAYSDGEIAVRDLIGRWMDDAGLHVVEDPAANLIGSRPGKHDGHRLVIGGHLDATYGVLAAIEVADALRCLASPLHHGLAIVTFSNDKGLKGTAGTFGSRALVGEVNPAELNRVDAEGVTLRARLAAAGGAPERLHEAGWELDEISAFVELHIEQAPRFDSGGCALGVIGGICGRQSVDITVRGISNHAGTVPMGQRKDALCAAAELILVIEGLGGDATIGQFTAMPNVTNVIPGSVEIGVEIRNIDAESFDVVQTKLEKAVEHVMRQRAVRCELSWKQMLPPIAFDTSVVDAIRRGAAASGHEWVEQWSGASHDAQVLARHLPLGMIFVQSLGACSRDHIERTRPEDLVAGAELLYSTLLELDRSRGATLTSERTDR